MNDELPKLAYLRTNPHTGTHFMFDLLRSIDVMDFRFIGIHGGKMFPYMRQVIDGELSYEDMMVGSLDRYGWPHTLKYFGIFEHLALPGTPPYKVSDTWLHDFAINGYPGYPVKTVMPLRNYRDAILSILSQHSINYNDVDRGDGLNWLRMGYKFMAEHVNDANYFYVPIDLLGKKTVDYRLNYVRKLFSDFLDVRIYEDYFVKFVTDWKPIHTLDDLVDIEQRRYFKSVNKEFGILMDIRDDKENINVKGRHEMFDAQMDWFRSNDEIQRMFRCLGYDLE